MPDYTTALAIITIVVAIVGVYVGYLTLRRTPKPPKPSITPTCTTILGASMESGIKDLPAFSPSMRHGL